MPVAGFDRVAAGVHQVGLAQAHAAVEIKRGVSSAGSLGDGKRSRVRKLVAGTNHETLVRVFGTKRRFDHRWRDGGSRGDDAAYFNRRLDRDARNFLISRLRLDFGNPSRNLANYPPD